MKYDVAIIGAGPGGAYCAKTLAEKGLKVLILDKKKFPGGKPCGGLISNKALKAIKDDCISEYILKIRHNSVYKIILTSSKTELFLQRDDAVGVVVRRKEFDESLIDMAMDSGAKFMDNCEYKFHTAHKGFYEIHTTRGTVSSDYLIGADGVFSRVARVSGLRQRFFRWEMGLAVSCEIPKESVIEKGGVEFTFPQILGGMGWCFSGRDFVNMGVGGYAPDNKRILRAANELVTQRLRDKNTCFSLKASFLPAGGRQRKIAKERIFLVGDAAGFVDAFSGEGIYYALTSGKVAADIILKNQTAMEYEQQCYRMFLDEFRFSAVMSVTLGNKNKIYRQGADKNLLEAFCKILTVPPENDCYKNFIYSIIKREISPIFPYLWIKSMIST